MDADDQSRRAAVQSPERGADTRRFARRIDCAPAPRRPEEAPPPHGHGYGRAPGEDA